MAVFKVAVLESVPVWGLAEKPLGLLYTEFEELAKQNKTSITVEYEGFVSSKFGGSRDHICTI